MAKLMQDKIKYSLQAADGLYHRLVLLVGESGTGKTSLLRMLANDLGTESINLNLALSAVLLELTAKQRTLRLPQLLNDIVVNVQAPVLLDNIEILFDTVLKQDPLRLLKGISRDHTILATWNGTMRNGKLLYAEPDHPEYRSYDVDDMLIVGMDGTSTIDLTQEITGPGQP